MKRLLSVLALIFSVSPAFAGMNYPPLIPGAIPGDISGNLPSSPNLGQIISSNIPIGSAVSASTTVPVNITSVVLTAGDWDCWGTYATNLAGTTIATQFVAAITTSSATLPTPPNGGAYFDIGITFPAGSNALFPVGRMRITGSGSQTLYLVGRVDFSVSTASLYGYLGCTRAS